MKWLGHLARPILRPRTVSGRAVPHRRAKVPTVPSVSHAVRAVLLAVVLALCTAAALCVPTALTRSSIHEGDTAQTTILAPRDISFIDVRATNVLRQQVARSVPPVYTASAAGQLQARTLLGALLDTASGMQFEHLGTSNLAMRITTLVRISQDSISSSLAGQVLKLSPRQLSYVKQIVDAALVRASGTVIRPADLPEARQHPAFPEAQQPGLVGTVATQLFADFLRPNRVVDSAASSRAQQMAASTISPVHLLFRKNQAIVRANDQITPDAYTALQLGGLTEPGLTWQDLAANLLIASIAAGLLHGYLISIKHPILVRPRRLLLLDAVFLATTAAAAMLLQGHGLVPYVFPAALLGMLITALLSAEVSIVATTLWAMLAGWYMGSSLEIAAYFLTTGLTGALLVRDVRRSSEFFLAAFWTSVVGLVTIIAFKLLSHGYDWLGLGTYTAAVLVSAALAAALTLGSLSALGRLFGVTTGINLLEISHPNHPLLRRLMQEAPGTFHHSMMIGTLAERAAEQIGADPLLVRIAAYFHDIGKLSRPSVFAENQIGIANVHESIEPRVSVDLIMQHVYEGVRLARQYHLPEVLEDGIWQHHGTTLVSFFYQQAVAMYGQETVPIEEYRYPGPKPQSREMAILMLADVVEAAVRASPGVDGNQMRAIIHRLGQERLQDGQFDECNLTLRDLAVIEESFATVLQGLSHPRVQYPAPVAAVSNG